VVVGEAAASVVARAVIPEAEDLADSVEVAVEAAGRQGVGRALRNRRDCDGRRT
jgi:hypothetical protein